MPPRRSARLASSRPRPESPGRIDPSYFAFLQNIREPNLVAPAVYPFNQPLRFSEFEHVQKYYHLSCEQIPVLPQLLPHKETFEALGVEEEVRSIFLRSGLQFLYREDPGTHARAVLEFLCSFEPGMEVTEIGVQSWRFGLANTDWVFSGNQLRELLQLPALEDCHPVWQSQCDVNQLWRRLTKSEDYFVEPAPSSKIKDPVWRLVHRLIASNVTMRGDYGATVMWEDLKLMGLMMEGKLVDWFDVLTDALSEYQSASSASPILGGGSFISHLASALNIRFGRTPPMRATLDHGRLVDLGVIDENGEWKN